MTGAPLERAMILAAGYGKRLRPLTAYFAKASLPLAGRALIEYNLRQVAEKGIHEVVVNLHHHAEAVGRCLDRAPEGLTVHRSYEPELLGTAGGLKKAEGLLRADTFLLLNGDTLTEFDLTRLLETHRRSKAEATLLLRPMPSGAGYTGIRLDEAGRVRALESRDGEAKLMFAGVWLLEPSVLAYLSGSPAGLAQELLPRLVEKGAAFGCVQRGPWITIDTPWRYWEACLTMARERLFEREWAVRAVECSGGAASTVLVGAGTEIDAGAEFEGEVVLGANCRVEKSASLKKTVCWDGVEISSGVSLANAVVTHNVRLPAGTALENKVIMKVEANASGLRQREIRDGLVVANLKRDGKRGV